MNAAIKEFAQKGFENASTNEIIKEANISKGLLFHYFNNKKDLFLFLYNYSIEIFLREFFGKIDMEERDILKRLRQMAFRKIKIIKKYPELFNFILIVNVEDCNVIKYDLDCRNKEMIKNSYEKLFRDIDISKFKADIDLKSAMNIIIWTLEGFTAQEKEKAKYFPLNQIDYEKVLEEMDVYLELLRISFYK